METVALDTLSSVAGEAEALRSERLREIVLFALERLGGRARISQRKLAQAMGCAPTMVTRYLTGQDPLGLKVVTLVHLARVAGLHPGTLHVWLEDGRDLAMAHERRVSDSLDGCQPIDLAKELVRRLEGAAPEPPALEDEEFTRRLRDAVNREEAELGGFLFTRMCELADATEAVEELRSFAGLTLPLPKPYANALARLLNLDPDALEAGDIQPEATASTRTPATSS